MGLCLTGTKDESFQARAMLRALSANYRVRSPAAYFDSGVQGVFLPLLPALSTAHPFVIKEPLNSDKHLRLITRHSPLLILPFFSRWGAFRLVDGQSKRVRIKLLQCEIRRMAHVLG